MIAALFVEKNGIYANLPNIDVWDITRDARNYSGPYPVIAHPPCQLWGSLAYVNHKRWGGEHNKPGNDQGCFESALNSVRTYGGVLEHPAESRAFWRYLQAPTTSGWQLTIDGDWVCEVWQSAYGHLARKRTWLCYHGKTPPHPLRWEKPSGTHQISHDSTMKKNKPVLRKKAASATPIAFRNELIKLALLSI